MIAKISVGRGLRGSLNYDLSPKNGEPHRAEYIGGTLSGTARQMSSQAAPLRSLRPSIAAPVWRCSLSAEPNDGVLDATKWHQIARDFLRKMGVPPTAAWAAVRHNDRGHDHIHLTLLRCQADGSLWDRAHDVRRAISATAQIEEKFGLNVHSRERSARSRPSQIERQIADRKGQKMTTKEQIQIAIDEIVLAHPQGLEFDEFSRQLKEKHGIEARASVTQKGRLQGFSFGAGGVALPGSKLGTDYSLGLLARGVRYTPPPPNQSEAEPAVKVEKNETAFSVLPKKRDDRERRERKEDDRQTLQTRAAATTPDQNPLSKIKFAPGAGANQFTQVCCQLANLAIELGAIVFEAVRNFFRWIMQKLGFGDGASDLKSYATTPHPPARLGYTAAQPDHAAATAALQQLADAVEAKDAALLPSMANGTPEHAALAAQLATNTEAKGVQTIALSEREKAVQYLDDLPPAVEKEIAVLKIAGEKVKEIRAKIDDFYSIPIDWQMGMMSLQTEVAAREKELATAKMELEKHKKNHAIGSFFGGAEVKKLEKTVQAADLKLTGSKSAQKTADDKLNQTMEAGKKKPVPEALAAQLDRARSAELSTARNIFAHLANAHGAQEYLLKPSYSPGSTEPRNRLKAMVEELDMQTQSSLHPEVFGLVLYKARAAQKEVQMYVRTYLAEHEQNQPRDEERRAELETPRG